MLLRLQGFPLEKQLSGVCFYYGQEIIQHSQKLASSFKEEFVHAARRCNLEGAVTLIGKCVYLYKLIAFSGK